MATETVILGTHFRDLKAKPVILRFTKRTGHGQLLNQIADQLEIKAHRWASVNHDRVFNELVRRPRDIQIAGAHHLTWKALEILRDLWDESDSEGPRRTLRIVMTAEKGFIRRIAKRHPQLADRVGVYPNP